MNELRIKSLSGSSADLRAFIHMPRDIYRGDPNWVPPLLLERKRCYSRHNPFFEHASWQAWMAYRGKRIVGRISAQIDRLHQEQYGDHTGYFGCLEAWDDGEVFSALFAEAERWLVQEGMKRVIGPFNLSSNQESGLLVEGFDSPPCFMMNYSPRYYAGRIAACHYRKAMDLFAYHFRFGDENSPRMRAFAKRYAQHEIRMRTFDFSRRHEDMEILRDIFNDAWRDNWGFVPWTEAEFHAMGNILFHVIPKDLIWIVEYRDEPVAFMIMIPDLNEVIADLDGRLFPTGWLKILWRVKFSRVKPAVRLPLMGIRRRFQQTSLVMGLICRLVDVGFNAARAQGIRTAEFSWILANNAGMRNIIEVLGGQHYKTYRVYSKELDA